jgi:hypothetical protein
MAEAAMTTRIACIVIATERRRTQVERVIVPNIWLQDFDEVVVVGDWTHTPRPHSIVYKYHCVAPLTRTTIDALVKRDIGTLCTTADIIVYLNDDHKLHPGFGAALRAVLDEPLQWDVIVPNRLVAREEGSVLSPLNNGERGGYCGGHAGVFRRDVVTHRPWSTYEHHRNWDALISQRQISVGVRFIWSPRDELSIIDIEPKNEPWK